jgi:uncharacterized membrane protein
MSPPNAEQPGRSRRWLVASVLLNVLLIGVLIGAAINRHDDGPAPGDGPPVMQRGGAFTADRELAEAIFAALTRDERRQARRELRRSWGNLRARREAVSAARQKLRQALTAEPFDGEAVADAMDAMRREELAVRLEIEKRLLALLARLDPEARARLVERFDNPPARPRHGRFRRGDRLREAPEASGPIEE